MILGAILAGGQSSRFGSDKAMALLDGRPLIEHAAAAIQLCDQIVVCGRDYPGMIGLPDRPRPLIGPLGGICAALRYGADNGFSTVLSIPCDVPGISPNLLISLLAVSPPCYLRVLPVLGIWPAALAGRLTNYLAASDDHSMRGWARRIAATPVDGDGPVNVNTPQELELIRGLR